MKKIVIGALILGGLVGGFLGIRYQIRLYNTVIIHNAQLAYLKSFLATTFPEQAKEFDLAIKAQAELAASQTTK